MMKHRKRFLPMLLCMVMILSMLTPAAKAAEASAMEQDAVVPEYVETLSTDGVDNIVELEGGEWIISEISEAEAEMPEANDTLYGPNDMVAVIVVMDEAPLLEQAETMGLSSDMPAYLATAAGAAAEQRLLAGHAAAKMQIQAACGSACSLENSYDYTAVLNGFSMELPYGKLEAAKRVPGVKEIYLVEYYDVPKDMSSYDLAMDNSTGMIGADEVFQNMSFEGHDGAGAVVAILDTGLDTDHEAFSVMPETVAYTLGDVQTVMDRATLSSGVKDAAQTYLNAKVPYAYDYADGDTDVNGDIDHGVHVAGTVAGNNGEDFFGVAPNAQLMIMKVFGDGTGSTGDDIITAGLDDAVKLGADSINMSLGSAAGFSWTRATEEEVYNNCWDAGINLLVAAGNETSSAYANQYGNNLALADSVDKAIVATPSTGYEAMSVASVQNAAVESNYFLFNGEKIAFGQAINANRGTLDSFWSKITNWSSTSLTFEYVVIPGYGEEADYEGISAEALSGKLALIQRGVSNFEDKVRIAYNHGAKAAIIYNNVGGVFNPAYNTYWGGMIGISQEAGEMLIAAENKVVTFGPSTVNEYPWSTPAEEKIPWTAVLPASDGGQISSFSSIGPAPDLTMKPEIAAPGGNIVSSVIGGGYSAMSGTSMATPHLAGAAAIVRNYVENVLGYSGQDVRDVTESLLMSTAVPAKNTTCAEYGPRWQGAGVVNVANAVTAEAYLTVNHEDASDPSHVITVNRPKAELGWNESGAYSFAFDIHNISDKEATYTLFAVSLSEGITEVDGIKFSDGVTCRLGENDFIVTYGGAAENGTVTVPAGKTVEVTVTLSLTKAYQAELLSNFANGNYVEGYIYLQPTEGVQLVLPYLGYFGDWTAGTVFEGAPDTNWLLRPTQFATAGESGTRFTLGQDAYKDTYNYDRLAFAPKISGAQQTLALSLSTRRNLTDFSMRITDPDTGETIWGLSTPYLPKTYYYAAALAYTTTQVTFNGWTGCYFNEETGAYDGKPAETGKYYNFIFAGNVAQTDAGYTEQVYPFWLDGSDPVIDNIQCFVDEEDGKYKMAFDVQDDHYVRMVNVIDSTSSWLLTYTTENFADLEPQGSKSKVILDIEGLSEFLASQGLNPGRIKLEAMDYSLRTSSVYVDLGPQYMSLSSMTIAVGDSQQAELRVLPARLEGTLNLTWTSADETIAAVDGTGLVTGVAKGETAITVTADSGLSASAKVTVGDETLEPENPEVPEENPHVDYPSAEAAPDIWDTSVAASDTERLGQKFLNTDGFWYKITGADTAQLIADPGVTGAYSTVYPNAPAELVIPETVSYEGTDYTVTSIGPRAFYLCKQVSSVTLPDTIRVIGDNAFQLALSSAIVTDINLPEGLEEVGVKSFYGCMNVDFRLPDSLRYIGSEAFASTGITEVVFGASIESIESRAFSFCTKLTKAELPVIAQDTEGLYLNCTALRQVEIEDGVERIPVYCFYATLALRTIDLPDSVKEICMGAFYSSGLEELCLEGTNVTTIGNMAYAGLNNCNDFVIPDTVTYVGSNLFYGSFYVRSITLGKNVAYVGNGTLSSFAVHPDVDAVQLEVKSATAGAAARRSGFLGQMTKDGVPYDVYTGAPFSVDGIDYVPISANEVMVTHYDANTVVGVVNIPETVACEGDEVVYTVTAVGDRLFSQKYGITEIHLPDTITTVGERAFDQVRALEYINIPKGLTTLTGIQPFGYGGWDNLVWSGIWNPMVLEVPGTLKTWNNSAFAGNKYTKVVFGNGLEMVGEYGLSYNKALTEVEMPGTIKYLKTAAFFGDESLESIELPEGLLYIGRQTFMNTPLKMVSLPDTLQYIGTQAFESLKYDYSVSPYTVNYVGVEEVTIPGGVIGLGWNAFYQTVNVTTTLGSQRNLVVERCDLDTLPTVCWDGRTDIPAGDYSVIPEGVTVTVSENVRIDGELIVEGTLIIEAPAYVIGDRGSITGDGTIENEDRIVDKLPDPWKPTPSLPTDPKQPVLSGKEEETGFVDLEPGAWYEEAVAYVAANGLMNGTSSTTFSPEATLTRGMVVTILHRMEGLPAVSYAGTFSDVAAGVWYTDGVEWAAENSIVTGYTTGKFGPEDPVTREQLAAILYRYAEYKGYDVGKTADLSGYTDGANVSEYAKTSVAWAVANGILESANGKLRPRENAIRAEVALAVAEFHQQYVK